MIEGERVVDLVANGNLRLTHHARLPQGRDLTTEGLVALGCLLGRERGAVAIRQHPSNGHVPIENALPLHLRRVSGQDGADQRLLQHLPERGRIHSGGLQPGDREHQRSALRLRSGELLKAGAPVVVPVLGDVGKMGEVRERAHDGDRGLDGKPVEYARKLGADLGIAVLSKPHGGSTNLLDHVEHLGSLLPAERVAEHAPEQPNVLAQREPRTRSGRGAIDLVLRGPRLGGQDHERG